MPFSMLVGFSVMILLTISVIIAVRPSDSNLATWAKANKDGTPSDGESLQYVIYENSTFGIRIEFPRRREFEVADNVSENPLRVVYFYNNSADLLGDFVIEIEKLDSLDSVGDYVANTINQYSQNAPEFKLLSMSMNDKLGGLRAFKFVQRKM